MIHRVDSSALYPHTIANRCIIIHVYAIPFIYTSTNPFKYHIYREMLLVWSYSHKAIAQSQVHSIHMSETGSKLD